jgi:3D (Asp-Asp-Asp) domain-containing protein
MLNKDIITFLIISIVLATALGAYKAKVQKDVAIAESKKVEIIVFGADARKSYFEGVTVTAYSGRVEECNDDPGMTALMEPPMAGRTVAVSRDFMPFLGRWVYIPGVGVRRVNDLMNARFERRIDIFMPDAQTARAFGKQQKNIVFYDK